MRVHVLTTVILTFADCLLYSDSQETENGLRQYLSPNPTLTSSPVKAVANQTSLNQTTNGNSSAPEEAVLYLSPFQTVRRHRLLYADANHTLPLRVAHHDSGTDSRKTFSFPPNFGAMHYPIPTSRITNFSMPTFRTRYHFTPAFPAKDHSVPDSPAAQNASHEIQFPPTKHVQTESSLDQVGSKSSSTFKETTSVPLSRWLVPNQSLSKVSVMPTTTKLSATNQELFLKPIIKHSLPTLKGSKQSSFVPDSKNYSSSFSILSSNPRSTLIKRNYFNVDQYLSSHSSNIPSSNFLLGKAARRSLPLSFGSSHFSPTKVVWNTRKKVKPDPLNPHNSLEKGQYLSANNRTDASQSPWNTTVSLNSQPKPNSSIFDYHPLSHSPSIPEVPISTTTDTIIRVLDSDIPVSSVNTNNETPRLKNHEEKATTTVTDALGRNEITSAEEITALADANPWDKKVKTTANHAIDNFLNPGDLANDFSEDFTIALTNTNKFSDVGTYDEERDGGGLYFDSSMVKDNTIIMDHTDLLEEDLRVQDLLEEDDFFEIDFPDWEEDYPTDVDDSVVLTKDSIDITRIFPKGMASWAKLPVGINDAVIPKKDAGSFTRLRGIPEYVAVPTSNAIIRNDPTDDATKFSPKMFVRKSGIPLANSDKYLAFTTVAKTDMATGDQVTSEVNDIPSIRNSDTPIQQIILTKFKPEINLFEKEDIATGNAYVVFLESSNAADKNVVDMTQLWSDNSITENYTILPDINATISTVRIPNLTNMPTRPPMPDAAVSKVNIADPLLNNLFVTPMKETLIKENSIITNTKDDSSMDKGQQILSDGVISRSSTPREDTTGTIYTLPRMDETFADRDTIFESNVIPPAKANNIMEADKVILTEENTPKDKTLKMVILDDNDRNSAKDNSFMPQVHTAEHLVDRIKYATNPTQSDPKIANSATPVLSSTSDKTVTSSRKVHDIIPFMEENPESEIMAPIFLFGNDPNYRDMTSRSIGDDRISNHAKTSREDNTATENKLIPIVEYYDGSEKDIMSNIIPSSFAFGSNNGALDVDNSDTTGFYVFQNEYDMTFSHLGDKVTIPEGSHSYLAQALDSKGNPTPLLYEMTNRENSKNSKSFENEMIPYVERTTTTQGDNLQGEESISNDNLFINFLPIDDNILGTLVPDDSIFPETDGISPITNIFTSPPNLNTLEASAVSYITKSLPETTAPDLKEIISFGQQSTTVSDATSFLPKISYLGEKRTIHNDAILPIKNVTENVDQMTTPLHSNILKDYDSVSEDSRTVLKTDDTDPVMDITTLTYGPDGFQSPAPNYLSSIIIPDDAVVTENHRTMFIGEDNSDTEADNRNLIDPAKLQVVNLRTIDDSIFIHTEKFTPASREIIAIATNDMDFLPEMSNAKVKKTLHSSVPDTVLNTRPHIIDRTDSSSKDKLPLIKNDTSVAYDAVRLPADTATTTADPKTQEDKTNAAAPELKTFKFGVDPVISFTDFVIDELPYEREEVLHDPMAKGVITPIDRATSIVVNGTTLPGKDNNAKEQFIIPGGADIALFKGDVPLVTSEIFSQLPDITTSGAQSSVFIEEESLTDPSMTVASKKSEPLVENIKTINKASNPEEQIFKTQRDHYTLPLETIILPADSPTYSFSPTSSEHSSFTMGASNSMAVKDYPISNHGQRDNSERLVLETIPTEKSSYMGVENVTTQAEGNSPYNMAYNDFVLGNDVNRTGVSTTNSLLIHTDIKMAVDRKSTALSGERTDIESNSTNNPTEKTNSKTVVTRTLVKATPGVQEIAFVEKKNGETGKVVAFFLPNMRSLENIRSYDALPDTKNALPVEDISSFTTDGTDSNASSTTPRHIIHTSSKNATGPIDHTSTEPAPSTPDGIKAHTKDDRTGMAEITNPQNYILPVTSTSIPSTEGISYVDDGTEIPTHWITAATLPNAYAAYTEAGNNLVISERNHSLSTGYDRELYKILTRRNSKHESKEREERESDKSILEVTNITPFFSHDSISQRHKLVPEDILIDSDEGTTFILDPNEILTYEGYSSAKATNSPPETSASELEEFIILEKDGLIDMDTVFLLPDISYPERKRNGLKDDLITPERAKASITTKTEAFASKDRGSFENKIASEENPIEVSGAEIKKIQEAEASPVTYFITPEADSYFVGANTEHLIDVTATSAFLPTKRSTSAKPKAPYARYIKSKNDPIVSEADSTLVSRDDTTSLIDDPLNFNSYATAGIPPETLHLKETSLDDVYMTMPETSRPVSEKSLSVNGSPIPGWNVINVHSDPQALQLESTFPLTDFTLLSRNLAYTYPDAVDTVKLDPTTETITSGEKYLSPKNALFGAVTNNLRDDTNFMIETTTYDIPIEKITSDNIEVAFQREEVDPITGDDVTWEGEKVLYSIYSSPFMSDNNILEGKKSHPEEDDFIFLETKNNHVITDGVNPPPQKTTNRETKSGDYISPEDEKPFTVGDSAIQTAADSVKTMAITADTIPGGMIKMTPEFKEMTNEEQHYSEAANMTFLPYITYLSIKRKAQKDSEVGLDMLSPLPLEDTKPSVAGSTGPISIATSLEVKDNSTFISGNHATNTAAGVKSPEKENKTAIVEMTNYQNNISPVTSITALPDVRMPYANKGNKYITDLASKEVIPLIEKNSAFVTGDTTFPSEYIQPNDESTASEVGTPLTTRGGPLTALPNPTPWHHAHFDWTPVTSEDLGPRADNSLLNDVATLNQSLPEVEANIPALPLAATPLPYDSKTSIIKIMYTRHVAATANKKNTPTAMVPDILIPSTNGPGTEVSDITNPSSYQPAFIKEESAFMKINEVPFVKEISAERKGVSLAEENTYNNDLMTLALDNNVTAYVTEEYTIAPPTPIIISMPTLTYEPSELGTYASYNKADSSYSAEIVTANPMQTNSTETSHTVILKYEPPDSEIHTTMLKSVAPRTMAHSTPDESKKMPSKFLKETAVEQDNKVVEDATTFMPETSNPRKKRTDFSNVLDPDTGFPMEESRTFIMDNVGSAGEPGPIKNKEVLGTNVEADIFKPEKTSSVTAVEAQYVKDDFKTIGSEMSTSQYSTIPSALFMFPDAERISHMDENMEMITDVANMPAAEKVTSVGALPAEDSETPLPRTVVTMTPDNNLLLTHETNAKTNNAAISLQEKNEALSDDSFIVSGERETVVEQMKSSIEDDITGVTLLNNNANPIASEDNIIQVEDSLLYDTDLIGRDKYNSENNDIILESNTSDLNKVSNSCLSNRNGLETIYCKDLITFMEKNGEDKFYAKDLPGDKAEVPMEAQTVTDVITEGIKTTNQEITAVEKGNRVAIKVTSFESDMPLSETTATTHKDNDITSDRDSTFTATNASSLVTGSTNLAENITSLENQETSVLRDTRFSSSDTVNPRVEPKIIATDAISQKREKNQMADFTNLENDVIPTPSFISLKIEDIEPVTELGTTDATTSEEEATTSMFSASAPFPEHIKPENYPIVSRANSPESTGDTILLKDATVDNNQETLPSKETSLNDTNMAMSEASKSVSKKPLPVNGAPLSGWNVVIVQSDPQALQPESELPPVDSTHFPRTPVYTAPDIVDTVIEDPVIEPATSGKKYPSLNRSVSADATINLREDTDFLTEASRYEDGIPVEEIISDVQEVAFDREGKDAITRDDVTQEEENTLYPTEFSSFISSSNILKDNVLAPEDYFIFPKRKDVSPISEVNEITADLSKFVAQPISPQNNIPVMTSFSVPEEDRLSFGNQVSETLSYSDLTGGMSSIVQTNPIKPKVLTPLPNRPADAFSAPGGNRISFENQDSDLTGGMSSIAQANPTMTRVLTPSLPNRPTDAISVPGGEKISLGNQDSETLSYSDLTDMSSIAQAKPTKPKVLTPLPNRSANTLSAPGGDRISFENQDSETLTYSDLIDMSSIVQANPTMTRGLTSSLPNRPTDAISVPGADRISFGNKNSESLSHSDLTGDMSSIAQANPTMTRGLTPSLTKIPGNGFFISGNGITKSNKDTTLSVETINIPEGEFTSRKSQDTHMAKDDSLADLKMAKSYLLNSMTDHSAPMNNLGILEQSITNTPSYLHAFPLDASKENIISSVDSIYPEYNPSIPREDTTSKMLYDAISTSPENSSLEKMLPVTSAAPVVAEDPPPKIYSPTPTTNITRNITEATVSSVAENIIPKVQIPVTSEGGHLTSVDNSIPESDFLTTAVNFISTFGNFISSVTDRLTLLKEIPTSEFNTKLQCIKTSTDDVAKCISSLTNTAVLSTDVSPLPEKEVIPHVTESISSTDNDAFLINDYAADPENTVSDFMVYDLEEWEITEFDRTIPSEEDDSNTMAFIPKDNIIKEKDTSIVFDLSNSEEEDITTSETNSIAEDTLVVNGFWIEGNPDDELNATALILDASKNKDYSVPLVSEVEHKNSMKAFLTKLVGRPNESVTNATDSLPGSLTEERYADPTKDSTPEADVTNLEEDDSKDIL